MSSTSHLSRSDTAHDPEAAVRALVRALVDPTVAVQATRAAFERVAALPETEDPREHKRAVRDAARAAAAEFVTVPQRRGLRGRARSDACDQTPQLLNARRAGTLTPALSARVDTHTASCNECDALATRFARADAEFDAAFGGARKRPALVANAWSMPGDVLEPDDPAAAPTTEEVADDWVASEIEADAAPAAAPEPTAASEPTADPQPTAEPKPSVVATQ
jgi:hypothetical protein